MFVTNVTISCIFARVHVQKPERKSFRLRGKFPRKFNLVVQPAGQKGYGAFAGEDIEKNAVVCEYVGKLISEDDIDKSVRKKFPPNIEDWTTSKSCFAFFFKTMDGKSWCIDAADADGPGRMINHSSKNFNLRPCVNESEKSHPRLFFKASRDIKSGEELCYDYGERDKSIVDDHPWLNY